MTAILVVEGNSPDLVRQDESGKWHGAAEQYAAKLYNKC